jgi:hypothetical protein
MTRMIAMVNEFIELEGERKISKWTKNKKNGDSLFHRSSYLALVE